MSDLWRIEEWNALPDVCAITACVNKGTDPRGPMFLRNGTIHKVCTEHWEAIFGVLGSQAIWDGDTFARSLDLITKHYNGEP